MAICMPTSLSRFYKSQFDLIRDLAPTVLLPRQEDPCSCLPESGDIATDDYVSGLNIIVVSNVSGSAREDPLIRFPCML